MRREYLIAIPLTCIGFVLLAAFNWTHSEPVDPTKICVQPRKLVPTHGFRESGHFFEPAYANHSAELLAGAVQIPTESYDDMALDPTKDPRFAPFGDLHRYLEHKFPLAAKHGNLEYVNTYGMLYTFKGSGSAKPALLMAHMDVVPVNDETLGQWDYPPFSGEFDGEWIHGRGAADTKNTVVGILEAIEFLLQQHWNPERTILVAYGFDEEISGFRGAGHLADELLARYGQDSIEIIVDEGFGNLESSGLRLACPLVTERGYLDVHFEVDTPGGHSSQPPDHTGIGIMSELIVELEDHAFHATIKDWHTHPAVGLFQCIAKNSPDFSQHEQSEFLNLDAGSNLLDLERFITAQGGATQFMIRTSQAVDIVHGGIKVNALPEKVSVDVNYRVSLDSTTSEVYKHVLQIADKVAREFGLNLVSEDQVIGGVGFKSASASGSGHGASSSALRGNLTVQHGVPLEAAPISPWKGPQWDLLGGVMRHVFEDLLPMDGVPLVIAPSMMTGNTDTRHYWPLSSYIYRYSPVDQRDMVNYHTVNERLRLRAHLATVAWYYELVQQL